MTAPHAPTADALLHVIETVTDPGRPDKANEDGAGAAGAFAWIIDGATGLGDRPLLPHAASDAAWLTALMGEVFAAKAPTAAGAAALLAEAAAVAEERFAAERVRAPGERYEVPTASVLLAGFYGDRMEIVELGDCALHLVPGSAPGQTERYGGTPEGRALEQANAQRMMATGAGRTPDVVAMLRGVRNKANTPDGYPIFAPDAQCTDRARHHVRAPFHGEALFMTDGFEAAIDDYELYSPLAMFDAARRGLAGPLKALRQVEADDPHCTRYPRFKPCDDATAMLVRAGVPS